MLISISVFIVGCENQKTKVVQTQAANNTQTKSDNIAKSTTNSMDTKLSNSKSTNDTTNDTNNNNLESSRSMTYQLVKNVYTNKKVTINYPQITNFGDIKKQKLINEIIKSEALKVLNYYKDSINEVTLNINYSIKLKDKNLLSVQYSGLGYSKGAAHPNNLFYTTNINLNSGTKLRLVDLVKIDESFVNKFRSSSYKSQKTDTNQSLKEAVKLSVQQITTADLIKSFNNADSLDNIGTEKQSDTFSYLTKDSLGISVSISHAAGDHAEFEIKYQDIQDNINTKNEVLNTLLHF